MTCSVNVTLAGEGGEVAWEAADREVVDSTVLQGTGKGWCGLPRDRLRRPEVLDAEVQRVGVEFAVQAQEC